MLQSGLPIPAIWSRPMHPQRTLPTTPVADATLALAGLGQTGVTAGFTALPLVQSYSATAGRYRLTPSGFVACAADEERLCFNPDGTFRGQYLQGADTYYSAPWHDPGASHSNADYAYLQPRAGGSIAYAGQHSEPDIFGGLGGGVVITQTDSDGSFHIAQNVQVTGVAQGDVLRHEAILAITPADNPGSVGVRGAGNRAFAFEFDHDASGAITGFPDLWSSYRAGFHEIGTIGGKRWYYLWVDIEADPTGTEQRIAINYSSTADETGRKIHICELMLRRNPACAPAAVPVCAAQKSFAADTLATIIGGDAGYVCEGLALARSRMPAGQITAPEVAVGVPNEPLETRIDIFSGTEAEDRSGVLQNPNIELYVTPWRSPATFACHFGPSYFPSPWLVTDSNKDCVDASIVPVFQQRRDLRPILGRHATSSTHLLGTLTVDKCIFLGLGDPTEQYYSQSDIRGVGNQSTFFLNAAAGVLARDCLVMGCPLEATRARHEIQADATPERQVYVGEFNPQVTSGPIDISGTYFNRLARFNPSADSPEGAINLDISDTGFDYIWSDFVYVSRGTYAGAKASRRFHGRATSDNDLTFWQSRKAIQVDSGSGFVDFPATGLTLADLPQGGLTWTHVGTWDFDLDDWASQTPNPAKNVKVRYYVEPGLSGDHISRQGFEWHANQIDYGTYSRHPDQGDVFEVTLQDTAFRVFYDYGRWEIGPVWSIQTLPARTSTGTHTDNVQINRSDVTVTSWTEHGCVFLNTGQGEFLTGLSNLGTPSGSEIDGYDVSGLVAVLEADNAFRFDWSHAPGSECSVANSVFVEMVSKRRLTDGSEGKMVFGVAGDNNTLNVGANVWVFSGASDPESVTGNGTMVGSLNTTRLPSAQNYSDYNDPSPQAAPLSQVLESADIDANSGQAAEIADPWSFAFADTATAMLGFDPNAKILAARAGHQEWQEVVDDLADIYFREPDHYVAIDAGTAVGTPIARVISATAFHARYGGNGASYFAIEGGAVTVARALTGLDSIFVLRGDNDETFVIDVS